MFDEIMDTLSSAFTITIIIGIVCVIVGIVKGMSESKEAAERKEREAAKNVRLINTVISESGKFSTDVLIAQRDEVYRAYKELEACKRAGSLKTQEMVWIRVGDDFGRFMDMNTCYRILNHLNCEIEKRK